MAPAPVNTAPALIKRKRRRGAILYYIYIQIQDGTQGI